MRCTSEGLPCIFVSISFCTSSKTFSAQIVLFLTCPNVLLRRNKRLSFLFYLCFNLLSIWILEQKFDFALAIVWRTFKLGKLVPPQYSLKETKTYTDTSAYKIDSEEKPSLMTFYPCEDIKLNKCRVLWPEVSLIIKSYVILWQCLVQSSQTAFIKCSLKPFWLHVILVNKRRKKDSKVLRAPPYCNIPHVQRDCPAFW